MKITKLKTENCLPVFSIFIIVLVCLFFVATDVSASIIIRPVHNQGLIGYWPMDEGAGIKAYDRSGNANHGTLTNMDEDTDWTDGQIGGALNFDGSDDQIIIADPDFIESVSEFSVSTWFKSDLGTHAVLERIVAQAGTGLDVFALSWTNAEDIEFLVYGQDAALYVGNFTNGITDTNWHHIVGVLDDNADTVTVYVDTVPGGTVATMTDVTDTSTLVLSIGAADNDATNPADGLIDDVRIYNRALTHEEIRRLYNMGR